MWYPLVINFQASGKYTNVSGYQLGCAHMDTPQLPSAGAPNPAVLGNQHCGFATAWQENNASLALPVQPAHNSNQIIKFRQFRYQIMMTQGYLYVNTCFCICVGVYVSVEKIGVQA